jgi:beta-mannosidase
MARELRPVNFGISRTEEFKESSLLSKSTDSKMVHSVPHMYGEKTYRLEIWGVNSTLEILQIPYNLQLFDISSGKKILEKESNVALLPNQSTEALSIDVTEYNPNNMVASVSFRLPKGEVLRSSADWPQPLKYLDFSSRGVQISVHGEVVTLAAEKPTKGVLLDVEGDDDSGIEWSDNGFDIIPGDSIEVFGKGLRDRKVVIGWYGQKL